MLNNYLAGLFILIFVFLQMYVDGEENTLVLTSLTPDTEYAVSVFSTIGEDSSDPLKGTETTCKLHKCLSPLCCPPPSPFIN